MSQSESALDIREIRMGPSGEQCHVRKEHLRHETERRVGHTETAAGCHYEHNRSVCFGFGPFACLVPFHIFSFQCASFHI